MLASFGVVVNLSNMQGPFDTFIVGGDTAEVCDIKFSNDGKSMLLATTSNNIYVLDAYAGEKVGFLSLFSPSSLQLRNWLPNVISMHELRQQNVRY